MITIRLPSAAAASALSRGLWLLSRPAQVNGPKDTQYLAAWVVQGDSTALLIVDPDWVLPIYPSVINELKDATDAEGTQLKLAQLLGTLFINSGSGTQAAKTALTKAGTFTIGELTALFKPALIAPYVAPTRQTP